MLVAEDEDLHRICGAGTIVVEPKFIHNAGFAGHLEDLVVDTGLRGKGIGTKLVHQLLQFARESGCYKVILDCAEHNVHFYEKCGFKRKQVIQDRTTLPILAFAHTRQLKPRSIFSLGFYVALLYRHGSRQAC